MQDLRIISFDLDFYEDEEVLENFDFNKKYLTKEIEQRYDGVELYELYEFIKAINNQEINVDNYWIGGFTLIPTHRTIKSRLLELENDTLTAIYELLDSDIIKLDNYNIHLSEDESATDQILSISKNGVLFIDDGFDGYEIHISNVDIDVKINILEILEEII